MSDFIEIGLSGFVCVVVVGAFMQDWINVSGLAPWMRRVIQKWPKNDCPNMWGGDEGNDEGLRLTDTVLSICRRLNDGPASDLSRQLLTPHT